MRNSLQYDGLMLCCSYVMLVGYCEIKDTVLNDIGTIFIYVYIYNINFYDCYSC